MHLLKQSLWQILCWVGPIGAASKEHLSEFVEGSFIYDTPSFLHPPMLLVSLCLLNLWR